MGWVFKMETLHKGTTMHTPEQGGKRRHGAMLLGSRRLEASLLLLDPPACFIAIWVFSSLEADWGWGVKGGFLTISEVLRQELDKH